MTVTFAEKLARMPGYQAGVPDRAGARGDRRRRHRPARLQRVAVPAAPAGGRGDRRAPPAAMNRYPDPDATLLRRRLAERYETEPGRVAVGNGSCEILLAAAEALCEPGAEILYAWPSFSMYPYLPALTGAREIRVPLAEGDVHDLEAMAAEVTAATQLLIVCNPNNPTATHIPAAEIAAFCERIPPHVTVDPRRGLRRVPDRRRPRRDASTCSPTSPTWSSCAPSASATAWPGCGSATRSARRASAPRSTPCASPSASTPSPRRPGRRRSCTRTTSCAGSRARSPSGCGSRRGWRELGLATAETQANFSWIDLGDADEAEVVAGLGRARDRGPARHAARRPRPHPRQLRHRGRERPLPRAACRKSSTNRSAAWYKRRKVKRRGRHRERPERPRRRRSIAAPFHLLLAI